MISQVAWHACEMLGGTETELSPFRANGFLNMFLMNDRNCLGRVNMIESTEMNPDKFVGNLGEFLRAVRHAAPARMAAAMALALASLSTAMGFEIRA